MAGKKAQVDPGLQVQLLAIIETIELVCKMLLALIPILRGLLSSLDAAQKQTNTAK